MKPPRHRYPPLLIEEDDALGPPRSVWLLLLAIVLAKAVVVGVVFATDFTTMSVVYFFITTWFWVLIGIVLMAGPAALTLRLRRMRKRRAVLTRSEWIIDDQGGQKRVAGRQQ
ncbi:hypothetical protein BH23CHL4_BH23CHL4_07710 [soil metagenome]